MWSPIDRSDISRLTRAAAVVALVALGVEPVLAEQRDPPRDPVEAPAPTSSSPRRGPTDAKVTIVEIADFQCAYCRRASETLAQIQAAYPNEVAIVWKNNPLPNHPSATSAASAAMAAHRQGRFWAMYDKLFANQDDLSEDLYRTLAEEIGLDLGRWSADRADPSLARQIANERDAAAALGQVGIPTFFVNGRVMAGAQPFETFQAEIDREIRTADALLAGGTPLGRVHEERARANLGEQFALYWGVLLGGKPAPKAVQAIDPTVWKVQLSGKEPSRGPRDALVTIVEFADFQCPYCARVAPTLDQLARAFPAEVRIVYKFSPLPNHPRAMPAAEAALAAHQQGRFWEMYERLYADQGALEDADLARYAREIGLDMGRFSAATSRHEGQTAIQEDLDLAVDVDARGTPNFFINGRNLRGAQPYAAFEDLVREELEKARALVAAGTPADRVYEATVARGKVVELLDPTTYELTSAGRPFLGNPRGDVVITVFADFQCPYCARAAPRLKEIAKAIPRAKVVYRFFPLSSHPEAKAAAVAAYCAHEQGRFWQMHDKIYAGQQDLSEASYATWAKRIGLRIPVWKACLASDEPERAIALDQDEATNAGIEGTPQIYVNGRRWTTSGGLSTHSVGRLIERYFRR